MLTDTQSTDENRTILACHRARLQREAHEQAAAPTTADTLTLDASDGGDLHGYDLYCWRLTHRRAVDSVPFHTMAPASGTPEEIAAENLRRTTTESEMHRNKAAAVSVARPQSTAADPFERVHSSNILGATPEEETLRFLSEGEASAARGSKAGGTSPRDEARRFLSDVEREAAKRVDPDTAAEAGLSGYSAYVYNLTRAHRRAGKAA